MIPDWEKKLIYELALYRNKTPLHPLEETFRLFRVDKEYLTQRLADDEFYRTLLSMQKEIDEKGVPFKLKARVIVDHWLDRMDTLMEDPTAPATAKVALFQHLTGLAGYESKPRTAEGEQREAVIINLNLGSVGADGAPSAPTRAGAEERVVSTQRGALPRIGDAACD